GPPRTRPQAPGDVARGSARRRCHLRLARRGHRLHDACRPIAASHPRGASGVRTWPHSGTGAGWRRAGAGTGHTAGTYPCCRAERSPRERRTSVGRRRGDRARGLPFNAETVEAGSEIPPTHGVGFARFVEGFADDKTPDTGSTNQLISGQIGLLSTWRSAI